jgi:hypothetical protein
LLLIREVSLTFEVSLFRLLIIWNIGFEGLEELDENDKEVLRREVTHKWHQPKVRIPSSILRDETNTLS